MLNVTDLGFLIIALASPIAGGAGAASAEAPWWVVSLCASGALLLGLPVALLSNRCGHLILQHESKSGFVSVLLYLLSPWAFFFGAILGLFSFGDWVALTVAA